MAFDRSSSSFLCPVVPENTKIRGSLYTEEYEYLTIKVFGCELGEECLSDDELIMQDVNFKLVKAIPNLDNHRNQDSAFIYIPA